MPLLPWKANCKGGVSLGVLRTSLRLRELMTQDRASIGVCAEWPAWTWCVKSRRQ